MTQGTVTKKAVFLLTRKLRIIRKQPNPDYFINHVGNKAV